MSSSTTKFARIPKHVGFIPDGNRRWAEVRGMGRHEGYPAGIEPGLLLLDQCRALGIEEVSVYGFTKENVHRASPQVQSFRDACVGFGLRAREAGAALLAVGDSSSPVFPEELRPYAHQRSEGNIKLNLLVNYGWQWDLLTAAQEMQSKPRFNFNDLEGALPSHQVSRIDLVVRWGGNRRLSGFLPIQCAYADIYVVDTLWPDTQPHELLAALEWYQQVEVTLGG